MFKAKHNIHYQGLVKLTLWPLVWFIVLVAAIFVAQLLVYQYKYIPDLVAALNYSSPQEMQVLVVAGINKIIVNLSVWIVALLIVNVGSLYILWNVRKLLDDMARAECEVTDSAE